MSHVSRDYAIPNKVRQKDVRQLVRYLKSMYTKIEAKEKINTLESRGRLEKGVHDNVQGRLDRRPESEFAEEIILIGGKHMSRSRSRSRRSKKKSNRKRNATRRR